MKEGKKKDRKSKTKKTLGTYKGKIKEDETKKKE